MERREAKVARITFAAMDRKMWRDYPLRPLLALMVIFSLLQTQDAGSLPAVVAETVHQACPLSDPAMNGTHEIFRGQDVIWQIPPHPRAILFLAHGGERNAFAFFDRGPGCRQCYGLPEDRMAVLDGLKEGYAVLALKSIGNAWSRLPGVTAVDDFDIATDLLKMWTRRHSLEHLPLIGWGHSSGGLFVSSLAVLLPLQSLVLMCSEGQVDSLEMATADRYPPTFFAYMNNTRTDLPMHITTIYDIKKAQSVLAERGVPVFEKEVFAFPLSPSWFAERIHCISEEVSRRIYEAFKADGTWLDERDYLVRDPFLEDWRSVLVEWNALPFCAEAGDLCLAEHVDEVLKVAQGYHSFMRDANAEIFAWLNSGALSSTF